MSNKSYLGYIILCEAEFLTGDMFVEVVYKSGIYFTRVDQINIDLIIASTWNDF